MGSVVGLYEGLLLLSILATGPLAIYTWLQDDDVATFLTVTLAATAAWASMSLLGALFYQEPLALSTIRMVFVFSPVVVTGLFLVAVAYTGHDAWLGPRLYAILAIEPVATTIAAWTNPAGLFWTVEGVVSTAQNGWAIHFGPLFWAHSVYAYAVLGGTCLWLFRFGLRAERVYRRQVFNILVSLAPPWIGNVLFLSGIYTDDLTPVAFALTGLGLTWGIYRTRLLDISPIARDAIVDTINDGVVVVDKNGRIADINPAGAELFGIDDSLVGRQIGDSTGAQPQTLKRLRDAPTDEGPVDVQLGDRDYTVDVTPLEDVRGQQLGTVFLIHDVTRQKARQRELEERNRQLDQFASVVSHDLRNPLHVASGALSLARSSGDPDQFDRVERAHDRMEWLIEDLLTLAREGDRLANVEAVPLDEIAQAAWDTVETREASLSLRTDTTVEADPNRLRQLFENLFRNAVEHAGDGVSVSVDPLESDGGFRVCDDGPGIPSTIRETVVDPGYSTEADGTGIGLSVVARVVDAHDWEFEITDSERGGACFEITDVTVSEQ